MRENFSGGVVSLYRNIGRYVENDSFIHKSTCLSKLLLILCTTLSVFITSNYFYFTILITMLWCLAILSKVRLSYFLRDIQSAWFLMLLAFLFQIIYGVNLHVLETAITNVLRIFSIIFVVSVFTRSTRPTEISHCLEKLLRLFGFNDRKARDFSITVILVLRFFPLMMNEIDRIRVSQTLRGVDISQGGIIKRLSSLTSIIIPVVVSTINRAEQLALAMDARRYGLFEKTSSYYDIKLKTADVLIIILSTLLICFALIFRLIR
ncbi:energy-coupling factor transporter transmembrane component T family protein [Thermotoga profunda]|uniref:energy-coupling factor transporter transmembrane component T family protein n=1 Tax=Thermotoga profunda TaxID=1508420 RepID=UPI0009E45ED5|nr:energy-coupling factor transporter transmembrane component T [Thermotoga profunda]